MKEHIECDIHDPFHNALRKNKDSFSWEVLSELEEETVVREHEQEVLDCFYGSEYCYNLSPYAVGGWANVHVEKDEMGRSLFSVEQAKRIHAKDEHGRSIHNVNLHKERDEQGRSLHAVNTLGEFFTDSEHQKKASLFAHSKKNEEGKSITALEAARVAHSKKDKWGRSDASRNHYKQMRCLFTNVETGEVKGPFPSMRVAEKETGENRKTIKRYLDTGKPLNGYLITSE
jgi:hypothetical protein